jgi:predicted ATP-dependent endonuclease of OLD family
LEYNKNTEDKIMVIESVEVKNFRSVLNETLHCENLTALVGANGAGKSTFLRALDIFYATAPRIDLEDFYNREPINEIVIGITYKDLSNEAKKLFSSYLQGEKLTVERVFLWREGKAIGKYHGSTLQNPEFQTVRNGLAIKDRGATAKQAYNTIRAKAEYVGLPAWSTVGATESSLRQWEAANPQKCARQRDDGQFFGFGEVGQGYLGKFTRFLFIPAVRDAVGDATEGRGSILSDLMDLVVRSVLANKDAVKQLKEDTQHQYEDILAPAKLTELTDLSAQMTKTLKLFVPDAGVELLWLPLGQIEIPMPKADVKLVEDGFKSAVMRTGNGLQRAFILTLLQHLAFAQTQSEPEVNEGDEIKTVTATRKLPNLVLAIEEPELYQHPNRQRHLAKILMQLSNGKTPGVAEKTQIIYGTHSPFFVGLDRIEQIRLLRKTNEDATKPKVSKIVQTSLDRVAEIIWTANGAEGNKFNGVSLLPRLQAIMTPWMSEGFFADVAVLVEGEDDRAAILGMASLMDIDLESEGFSIIPCGGKTSLDRPAAIFHELGIPVYVVWDGDAGGKDAIPENNRRLLRLMGETVVDWPSFVKDKCACFSVNLENTLREELNPDNFDKWLTECQAQFVIPERKHAMKNPFVISTVLKKAREANVESTTLKSIVEKIVMLKK